MELTAALPNINHAEGGSGSGATALSTLPSGTSYGGAVVSQGDVDKPWRGRILILN